MRTVYATQFKVEHDATRDNWETLLGLISEWIRRYYQDRRISISLPSTTGEITPYPEHKVSVDLVEPGPGKRFWKLDWIHPDDYDPTLLWHTQSILASSDTEIEVGIVVRVASQSFTIRPARFTLGRPWIVKKITTDFECKIGARTIKPIPSYLQAAEIDDFVTFTLTNSQRALPVVLVSIDPYADKPVVDVNKLADTLVGLAEVYVLSDKWAAFRLTDVVGQSLSCFNGAVRIYWPQFSLDSKPFEHPLRFGNNIRWHEENGRSFDEYLLRMLSAIASFRHTDGSLTKKIRDEADAQRKRHIDGLRQEIKDGNYNLGEAESFLNEVADENDKLRRERDQAVERLNELQEQLKTAKENLAAVYQYEAQAQELEVSSQQQDAEETFGSVKEAVEFAANQFGESLIFLPNAFESASDSPFKRPNRVYEALDAINEVCIAWADTLESGQPLGQSWIDAFSKRGFNYKDSISMTSMGKYEDDYNFTYEGQKVLFDKHITEGAKQADKCFSIHMYRDEDKRRIVIGHVGRHLTNTRT